MNLTICTLLVGLLTAATLSAQNDSAQLYFPRTYGTELGQLLVGYGYDGTHGPRIGLGLSELPSYGHFTGFAGYGFTATLDARFGGERTLIQPGVGAYYWLLLLCIGAEVGVAFDGEKSYLMPRFSFGAGIGGGRLVMTISLSPERPEGAGAIGAQLEYPIELWRSKWDPGP